MTSLRFVTRAVAFLTLLGPCLVLNSPVGGGSASADQPPIVIPYPQMIQTLSSEEVVVGRDGRNVTRVLLAANIETGADDLRTTLERDFQFQKSEPDGGDAGCWLPLVSRIRRLDVKPPPTQPPLRETGQEGAVTIEVSSVLPGYRAASVLTSDPTGRGWGQDGGWNDATAGQFPDTLQVIFREPRRLRQVDVYTLADQWQTLDRVDSGLEFQRFGITDLDVEVRPPGGEWRTVREIRGNRKVLMSVALDEAPVAALRLRVVRSADGQFSRIVGVGLR